MSVGASRCLIDFVTTTTEKKKPTTQKTKFFDRSLDQWCHLCGSPVTILPWIMHPANLADLWLPTSVVLLTSEWARVLCLRGEFCIRLRSITKLDLHMQELRRSRWTLKVWLQGPNSFPPLSRRTLFTPSSPCGLHLLHHLSHFRSHRFLSTLHSDLSLDCFKIPPGATFLVSSACSDWGFYFIICFFPSVIHLLSHFPVLSIIRRPPAVYQSISPVTVTSQLPLLPLRGTLSPSHHSFDHSARDLVSLLISYFSYSLITLEVCREFSPLFKSF